MITILEETTKYPMQLLGKMSGVYENSPTDDVNKNIERAKKYIKSGEGIFLEFPNVSMIIDGYSVGVIYELYTYMGCLPAGLQTTTRYVKCEDLRFITPSYLTPKQKSVYESTMSMIKDNYKKLIDLNISNEDAARILPFGMNTKIVSKINLQNLIDISSLGMCEKVYPEYKNLFKEIVDSLKNISGEWVWIINNCFHKKCKELGRCSETTDYKSAPEEKIELNKEEIFEKAEKGDISILKVDKSLLMIKDIWGWTPIHRLAIMGVKEILTLDKSLLRIKNKCGNTPIHFLADKGIKEILKLDKSLLSIKNNDGYTPIHFLADRGVKEILKLDKYLLMIKNKYGWTPIHWLAYNGVKEILKLDMSLLMIKDNKGRTPIHKLAVRGIDIPEELKPYI